MNTEPVAEAPHPESTVIPTGRPPGVDLAPLMEIDRGSFRLTKYFEFSQTGMTFRGKPPLDVCGDLCEFLHIVEDGVPRIVGDFVNGVESMYGEEASQLIDAANLSEATTKVYRWVCAKVPPSLSPRPRWARA